MGTDLLSSMHYWDDYNRLKSEKNFLIFNRIGYEIKMEDLPVNHVIIDALQNDISSSEIRKRIKEVSKL